MKRKNTARIRLRTILLIVNLMVFLLPLAGVMFFRVYENALVQQTENELISQAAVVSAMYKAQILERIDPSQAYGVPADKQSMTMVDAYYTPINPKLDLSKSTILPSRGDGKESNIDPVLPNIALEVGEILSPVIMDAQKITLSGIKVLDYSGVVVSGRNEVGIDFSDLFEVRQALSGYYTSVIRERISDSPPPALSSISRGTGIRVFIAMPIVHEGNVWGVVYLSRTPQNILKHMYAEKGKFIFAAFALICITMIIALFTSFMISRPIKKLIERTERFSGGDKDALRSPSGADVEEIALLSESFERMALSLNNRSEYIRDFAMHVSHEFKTPITAIQGSAELLLDHLNDMDESKKRKFLNNIINDSNRLKRLVRRLLELARADNIIVSNESCNPLEVFRSIQIRYRDHDEFDVVFRECEDTKINMSEENLETILINLCDNAYQNSAKNIEINAFVEDDVLRLILRDNGKGISKANQSKIFNPFFTTRKQEGGTGIGLGVISSILEAHDGTIKLMENEQNESGACFEISLPIIL